MKTIKNWLVQGFYTVLLMFNLFLAINCGKDQDVFDQTIAEDIEENLDEAPESDDEVEQDNGSDTENGTDPVYGGPVKAFPSAEGHGKNATGGRGGRVIFVTNLEDSGQGSFRDALMQNGPRNIVFRVSGYIELQSDLKISNGDVTIEGNTAPGGGVIIKNHGFTVAASNVIIRNLTRMVGDVGTFDNDDALTIFSGGGMIGDIIVDHCSFSLGLDENVGIQNANAVTISNCISANALDSGSFLVGSDYPTTNISFLNNLSVWNIARNPRFRENTSVEYINNYHYGYDDAAQMSYGSIFDMIGNVWENDTNNSGKTAGGVNNGADVTSTLAHISDNLMLGGTFDIDEILVSNSSTARSLSSGYEKMPSNSVKDHVLSNAGARRAIALNDYDLDLIKDIRNSVSRNYGTAAPFPFPSLVQGSPFVDSDGDGMEDGWERDRFGDLSQDHLDDFDGNGYTNLEEFFFHLNKE